MPPSRIFAVAIEHLKMALKYQLSHHISQLLKHSYSINRFPQALSCGSYFCLEKNEPNAFRSPKVDSGIPISGYFTIIVLNGIQCCLRKPTGFWSISCCLYVSAKAKAHIESSIFHRYFVPCFLHQSRGFLTTPAATMRSLHLQCPKSQFSEQLSMNLCPPQSTNNSLKGGVRESGEVGLIS